MHKIYEHCAIANSNVHIQNIKAKESTACFNIPKPFFKQLGDKKEHVHLDLTSCGGHMSSDPHK